ncbi:MULTISPECIES: helix-turn-helix transcriptional regulator [unclassified Xanthobacter]|uniref:helix-turn-helix transcriptional regulator n=1 Tax=unclassified Xanthobacter TaxID=2623496 RepID=UPI001EE0E086|nr:MULTISPECIES: helix-turn-helix transcriptional regulator [unclassified Xanthobacter]
MDSGGQLPSVNDAVYRIYEATLRPALWSQALAGVAGVFAATGALLYVRESQGWRVIEHSPELAEAVQLYRSERWWEHNPWLNAAVELPFTVGDVYCDHDVIADTTLESAPFYTDFLPRVGLGWQMVAVIHSELGAPAGLVVQRAKAAGPFDRPAMDRLGSLSHHVEQSLRISSRLATSETVSQSLGTALDSMDRAAFILDDQQRPVLMNRPAQDLVGRYFTSDGGPLQPASSDEHAAFAATVREAHVAHGGAGAGVGGGSGVGAGAPRPTTVSDRSGTSRLAVWAMPVVGASSDHLGLARPKPHVLVLAQPLEQGAVIDPSVIRSIFGLSLGEARLTSLLCAGLKVKQAAERLGITEGTARVVLKRVFQKLDVHRQAELVTKVSALRR